MYIDIVKVVLDSNVNYSRQPTRNIWFELKAIIQAYTVINRWMCSDNISNERVDIPIIYLTAKEFFHGVLCAKWIFWYLANKRLLQWNSEV